MRGDLEITQRFATLVSAKALPDCETDIFTDEANSPVGKCYVRSTNMLTTR